MILVTGATGRVGRALVEELDATGAEFRVLVRDPVRLSARADHVVGDLGVPETLKEAFDGVDKMFLLAPGIGLEHTTNVLETANDLQHLVLLSSYAAAAEPLPAMGRWHHEREQLIHAAGVPATFLRPTGFMTNTFDWLPTIREGYVLDPIGPGRAAPIDPADIAAVAAAVLTQEGHQHKAYTLTGEEVFTVAEQVAILATAIGRDLELRPIATPEDAVRFRYPDGAPPALAKALVEGLQLMRADTVGLRTDDVRRLLHRRPAAFADWCERNAIAFK